MRIYNWAISHPGCCYAPTSEQIDDPATFPAEHRWAREQDRWMRPVSPACGRGASGALFLALALANGATVRVPVCEQCAEVIEALYAPESGEVTG